MAIFTENKYLQDLLETLITTHETEIDYLPVEFELDPEKINKEDIDTILLFVSEARKRLFIFKLAGNELVTENFLLSARRSFLNQTAEHLLQRTSSEPRINPLKMDLHQPPSTIRVAIQIQKSFALPKQSAAIEHQQEEHIQEIAAPDLVLISVNELEHPILTAQLRALNIINIQDKALEKIAEQAHAFTDGLIPNNLPAGFYIAPESQALCYTDKPQRLPTALAPLLENPQAIALPTADQVQALIPSLTIEKIDSLLNNEQAAAQRDALLASLPNQNRELRSLINSLHHADSAFIVPLLTKLFILGGESQVKLFAQTLKLCITKNIAISFLKDPVAQDALLNPRGLKNLQKLTQLPAEQREWWNNLATAHLENPEHHFDFNHFFEAYTQIFLPQVSEKNLSLPQPCPIQHRGHFLISLNRIIDVLNKAKNPQEQCTNLNGLNWGPTGAHFAMTQGSERFKQVAACMQLEEPKDAKPELEIIYEQLADEGFDLFPSLYRYFGLHWQSSIRLTDIQAQFREIQTLPELEWPEPSKRQLSFILTSCFSTESELNAEGWRRALVDSITMLNSLSNDERATFLQALSRSFYFKPRPSFKQIQNLIEHCTKTKTAFNDLDFNEDIVRPLFSCLEEEGFELIETLEARVQKINPAPGIQEPLLKTIVRFTTLLQGQRENLTAEHIKLLASLNEPEITEQHLAELNQSFAALEANKGELYKRVLLGLLAKINLSKSENLPTIQQIQDLIIRLAELEDNIPDECNTSEKQEEWLKNIIIDNHFLQGCVLGDGDISKLDDLIVEALADAIKKRQSILQIKELKRSLQELLQSNLVPQQLKEQLDRGLFPLFDEFSNLIDLLLSPNPNFEEILKTFALFERSKETLLQAEYHVAILGKSKGEYLLSILLTGQKKPQDTETGYMYTKALIAVHLMIVNKINATFENSRYRNALKDLDAATAFKWLATYNETHSISFLFKEELVDKKVLPAIKKTLAQLNTEDAEFENSILDEASTFEDEKPSHEALSDYKFKIESIAGYLNLLIDIKDKFTAQFQAIYKQLSTGSLARLNYTQKQAFISKLLAADPQSLDGYLRLSASILDDNPDADEAAITRAINGFKTLFELEGLEPETLTMFFKMSMSHNLKNPNPFPLAILSELKQAPIDEEAKSLIIKQIIQILSQMSEADSPELIQGLIQQTQIFLAQSPHQAPLCISLLKRVSSKEFGRDLSAYCNILQQLTTISEEKREKLVVILNGLAASRKDDTVNMPALLDISKGLGRRAIVDLDQVLQLFETPPYPITQSLNSVLLAHGSEKLQTYCQNFDSNPFGNQRDFAKQFATDRIEAALLDLEDLMDGESLPHSLQLQLARQLTYIETLGYTDPLNPYDFEGPKQFTTWSRQDLKTQATILISALRSGNVLNDNLEQVYLRLLALLREIYFRSTGLFANTTQMAVLLLALHTQDTNLLMRIKTGEGKSLLTPFLAVLQFTQGGTVDSCTANRTLLMRDYENNCEPFFNFLEIRSALITADSPPEAYQLDGINCSTVEDMALFRLAAKEAKKEKFIQNDNPIHLILDECDDPLLDQKILYKLVASIEGDTNDNADEWIYPLAYQFINLPAFRNTNPAEAKVWDEDEDLEQFRLFLNKEINETFNGDAEKQNFLMAATNTQLKEWINASCKAALLVEDKHFIVRPIKEKDETGTEVTVKIVCVPLDKSNPKTGIIPDGVQAALQARLRAERKDQARHIFIDPNAPVLASQSAHGLIRFYQDTKGRIIGISGTPGDAVELRYLAAQLGIRAIGVPPHAGDKRIKHPPTFTFSGAETTGVIHKAINTIKRPVTRPNLQFEADIPIQTFEEREAFILRTKEAIQEWNKTQTQPILIICEDFNEARIMGKSLAVYQEAGFSIQVVTGKESPEELERIIKKAGQANTITIGNAMLARGIDINPGEHPEGLFVIQCYADSERITTQIAGRAARNGKPGQWLPVYQIDPPKNWLQKIAFFLFPWYRNSKSQEAVLKRQNEIKIQDNVDRHYTQAIDQAQQTLIKQIYAWESLLLELRPDDPKLPHELYTWRATLLSELSQAQETSVSETSFEEKIAEFNNRLCKIWETAKEEKWLLKAQNTEGLSVVQELRMNYLKQLKLPQELTVQRELQRKAPSLKAANKALMHQNLNTMIRDKAGAVLEYADLSPEHRDHLLLAQSRQLLPSLIAELCSIYPQAISELSAEEEHQPSANILETLNSLLTKVHQHGTQLIFGGNQNDENIQSINEYYQKELAQASPDAIRELLQKIKPLILADEETRANMPLIKKFKMQGLVLTFCKLYEQSGLEPDPNLAALEHSYNTEVMKMLADQLVKKFEWVKSRPQSIHAFLERSAAKEAANTLYDLAKNLRRDPANQGRIQALYAGLQEQRLNLQDLYLFSIKHDCPRDVINEVLTAIQALHIIPHCDREYQNHCHDTVLVSHHLEKFQACLTTLAKSFRNKPDPIWEHLKSQLEHIIATSAEYTYVITELSEAVSRFQTYPAYQPYRKHLAKMREVLARSMRSLEDNKGLQDRSAESFMAQKAREFASLFDINENQISIQKGTDSMKSYIELQIVDAPHLEGFTGYQSPYSGETLENELRRIGLQKGELRQNREGIINLAKPDTLMKLSKARKAEYEKLFAQKELLNQAWAQGLNEAIVNELPEPIRLSYQYIQQLTHWNWPDPAASGEEIQGIFGDNLREITQDDLKEYLHSSELLEQSRKKIAVLQLQIEDKQQAIQDLEAQRDGPPQGQGWIQKLALKISSSEKKLQNQLTELTHQLEQASEDEKVNKTAFDRIISTLNDQKNRLIGNCEIAAKENLEEYLRAEANAFYLSLEEEYTSLNAHMAGLTAKEEQKARCQTRRFHTVGELLSYQASVAGEKEKIPVLHVQERRSFSDTLFRRGRNVQTPVPTKAPVAEGEAVVPSSVT